MLHAYLDESGDHDRPYVCICGGIADRTAWERFEAEWDEVLTTYQVQQLHMAQLMARDPKEEYRGWSDKKRRCFLSDLMPILLRTVRLCIGSYESVSEYEIANGALDKPYRNCLITCLDCAAKYAQQVGLHEKVEMFFARNQQHDRWVRNIFPEIADVGGMYDRLAGDSYKRPIEVPSLQAADLIAWLYRKSIEPEDGMARNEEAQALFQLWYPKLRETPWCDNGHL